MLAGITFKLIMVGSGNQMLMELFRIVPLNDESSTLALRAP